MTDLITADLHLNDNPRDEYRWRIVDSIKRLIEKYKVHSLYILGDLTDDKDNHSAALANRLIDSLGEIADDCYVTILRGNHDAVDPSTPFFRFIGNMRNCMFATDTQWDQTTSESVLLVPHGCWPPKLEDLAAAKLVLTHNTFAGALAHGSGAGYQLEGSAIPVTGPTIISGDVHVPQRIGPVLYVGAPTLIDFGDDYDPRVLLRQHGKLSSIRLKGPNKRLVFATGDPLAYFGGAKVNRGDIVKVKVQIDSPQVDVAAIREQVRQWGEAHQCTVHAVTFDMPAIATLKPSSTPTRSDRDLVIQYAKAHKLDKATTDVGLSLIARPK